MRIPLLDMHAQHEAVRDEMRDAIARVLKHGRFVGGPEVGSFERAFADYCGQREAVGLASGTDALTLGLQAAGIGRGDEVITTAMTFIATVESIVEVGATPVLVDPDPDTALLTAEAVESAITPRTAAVVPVHLYGQPVDLDAFEALARRHGLLLAEDAAQAHGARFAGRPVGAAGAFAAFSFFPGKNLGALGDAGGLTTDDPELAAKVRLRRDHGRVDKYTHAELGVNARLDTLQAAILEVKLTRLAEWTEARREHAARYDRAFASIDGVEPVAVAEGAEHVYHQYVVRVADREAAQAALAERGIASGVHYPVPLNRQPALAGIAPQEGFPHADRLAATVLSLPVYPELPPRARAKIVEVLAAHSRATAGASA